MIDLGLLISGHAKVSEVKTAMRGADQVIWWNRIVAFNDVAHGDTHA